MTTSSPRLGGLLWPAVVVAVVYAVTAKVGLMLAFAHPSATAVWPPTGIALAALLLWGYRIWPAVFIAALLVNLTTAGSVATSTGIALGNTLEALVGCYLVNRFAGGRAAFERPEDTLRFAALAGLCSTAVSATCGVTTLALGGYAPWAQYGSIWLTWWLGNAGGALIVAPVVMLWADQGRIDSSWSFGRRILLEYLVLIAVGLSIFGGWLSWSRAHYPITFLAIPILVWMAFRLGRRVTATAVVLLSAIAIWGTLRGFGPFAGESANVALNLLQAYMSVMAVTAMTLAVAAVDRARMGLALEEQRAVQHMAALVEASNDAIFSTRLDGTILSWNRGAERLFGYGAEEIEGGSLSLLSPPAQSAELRESLAGLARGQTLVGHETTCRRKDGRLVQVSVTISPIRDAPGHVTAGSVVARDITEQKRTEEALRDVNHELDTFASTVSHDLRSPLRQLAGLVEALVEDYGDALDEPGRRLARRLSSVASRMDALTQRLLDYSRVSRVALPLGPVGLDEIVHDACAQLAEEIRFRDARVKISPRLPSVIAHESTLAHVIGNLLSNAIKYVEPDVRPMIRVWAEERGEWTRLWVEDNGLGIEPRFHERIFHPFERLQGFDAYAGTGLGLAIVKKGVERMGGRAGVESEFRQGSRFWVELKKECA
jgi:PAS domain S-box-containing protein